MPPPSDVVARYRGGAPLRALATHYGVSAETIRRWLTAQGEPLRSPGRPVHLIGDRLALAIQLLRANTSLRDIATTLGIAKVSTLRRGLIAAGVLDAE